MRPYYPNRRYWHRTGYGNYILRGNGYVISYNPSVYITFQNSKNPLAKFFLQEQGEYVEETALYIRKTDTWLILQGNFKREYEQCQTLTQCLAIYSMYAPRYKSKWSTE